MNKKQSNLYVKNFGQDIDESKLCQLFSIYGTITSCKIQTDNNGQSKGFGFVNFERPEMAKNAMEKLNGYLLEDGKNLYVGPFQRKSERQNELRRIREENLNKRSNNLCLYVSNLDTMVDEKMLEAIFNKFGRVTKTRVLRNGSQSKGIGFVCFNTIEETTTALNEMNGKWILSKPIYVTMSKDNDNSHLTTSNSPTPSPNVTYPPINPMPYLNTPTIFYVPTIVMPSPPNNFPLPIAPHNASVPMIRRYSPPPPLPSLNAIVPIIRGYSPPPPPPLPSPNARVPMIRGYSPPPPPPTTTPHITRQSYPYTRVKSDDQECDN